MEKIIWEEDRELTNIEYANLSDKTNHGVIPVEYFRKNLFNGTTRTSKELRKLKTIYDDGEMQILVNRSLHQKHRDVLSILFLDNKGTTINKDGSINIKTTLYHIAKEMGYSTKNRKHTVKDFYMI